MKEFMIRTTTALVLLAVVYAAIRFLPPPGLSLLLFAVISLVAAEFLKLTRPNRLPAVMVYLCGLIIAASFTFDAISIIQAILAVVFVSGLFFLFSLRERADLTFFVRDWGILFLTVFYLYIPLYFIYSLKLMGENHLFFLIAVIALGDSGAYFVGRAFGKHKIYPVASPNKTLEGLIAAILTAALAGWLAITIFPIALNVTQSMITGAVIGLFSQLSDPIESLFKRAAGKKDSASLLPGHGGFLDRLDSYIFCAPALYVMLTYLWG